MKTLSDIRFTPNGFLRKNDKLAILNWINENPGLFSGDHMVGQDDQISHHKTYIKLYVFGAGMVKVEKAVENGTSYGWYETVNFLVS